MSGKIGLRQCWEYILSDCYRYVGGGSKPNVFTILKVWYNEIGFRFSFWLRLSKCSNLLIGIIARAVSRHLRHKYGINILWVSDIGYGLRIVHGGPCVINSSAVIGDNVDIYQYVTIGSMYCKAAHIGNNVYIGPSVCIVENVNIGDGATIGAGAVVVKDVPEGATVAGVPAKVISHKEPGRLVWSRWQHNSLNSDKAPIRKNHTSVVADVNE